MTSAVMPPSRMHLTKLQVQFGVTGKEVSSLGAAVQDLDRLGSAAIQDVRPSSAKGFQKLAEAAGSVVDEIDDLKKTFKGANPKFMAAVERDYRSKAELIWDLRKFVQKKTDELYNYLVNCEQPLKQTCDLLSSFQGASTYANCATTLLEAAADCRKAAGVASEISGQLDAKPLAKAAANLATVEQNLQKLAAICKKLSSTELQPHPEMQNMHPEMKQKPDKDAQVGPMSRAAQSALKTVREALDLVK